MSYRVGTNDKLKYQNTVGAYYQSKQSLTFDNGFGLIPGPGNPLPNTIAPSVDLDLPENFGLGFANTSFMDGRLLLATDLLTAITSHHRISGGVGIQDLLPGIDMDMMASGMFRSDEQLGNFTSTSIESYWIGAGLTWRFGRGASCCNVAPNSLLSGS